MLKSIQKLSKAEQSEYRSQLFRHLDGIVTVPTLFVLHQRGVLREMLKGAPCAISELSKALKANEGYLNVALRVLSSQGWLEQRVDNAENSVTYTITEKGALAFDHAEAFEHATSLLKRFEGLHPARFTDDAFSALKKTLDSLQKLRAIAASKEGVEREVLEQMCTHIEGVIQGPIIVHLGMSGMFHQYFMQSSFKPEEFHEQPERIAILLDMFEHFGWFLSKNGTYQFTNKGMFYARRASAYGVTVSYIPTLRKLEELIFNDAEFFNRAQKGKEESHVDRAMNVWGSGGAHTTYFKIVDEIVIDIFNRPIDEQPSGILDMGCGNGAFIQHLYYVIEQNTLRGKMLDEYPLVLVGVDYNQTALNITKANLIQADIWAKVVWGDIGDPDQLAKDLKESYDVELSELLNVRTFLDHNRVWNEPSQAPQRKSSSTGAYAYKGRRIPNNSVEQSLVDHLKKWSPYVNQFGLLVIELHTLAPSITAAHLGKTAATAYDATHGYSDQYIVEVDVFVEVAKEAGLHPVQNLSRRFPDSELATVTVNLLRAKGS